MTDFPKHSQSPEIFDTLKLGISSYEMKGSNVYFIETDENWMTFTFNDESKLSIHFKLSQKSNLIVGMDYVRDSAQEERLRIIPTEPGASPEVYLFGERKTVVYKDSEKDIDDGVNIHISKLLKDLILTK